MPKKLVSPQPIPDKATRAPAPFESGNSPRLVAADMDGTLLTDAKTFDTDRFERILQRLQARGIRFVVASGNTYAKLTQYMRGFEGRGIIYIAENGAYIRDDNGEIAVHRFAAADIPRVWQVIDSLPHIGVIICTTEGLFLPESREEAIARIFEDFFTNQGKEIPEGMSPYSFVSLFYPGAEKISGYEQVRGLPIKISLQTLKDDTYTVLETLRRELPAGVSAVSSGFGAIDLVRTGVNKGVGLADLCNSLQIDPRQVLAFGDGDNDTEMLEFAGAGIAMEQAPESLRRVANTTIGSHNDGAVLNYLEELLDTLDAGEEPGR